MTSASKPPHNQQKSSGGNPVAHFLYLHMKDDTWGGHGEVASCRFSPPCVIGSDATDWEQLRCCKLVWFHTFHARQQIQDKLFLPFMSAGDEHRRGEGGGSSAPGLPVRHLLGTERKGWRLDHRWN